MALSTSSRFTSIKVDCFIDNRPDAVEYNTTDGDFLNFKVLTGPPASGEHGYDELEILKDIYESSDGFLDADGVALVPYVSSFDHGTTVESLEEYDSWNPLKEGSWESYQRGLEIGSALGADGSLERDSTTGQPTFGFEGVIETKGRKRDGSNFDAPLSNWTISFTSVDYIRLLLEIPSTDNISEDELDDYTDIRAMLAWLESKRTAGSAVGSDASDPNTILGGSRRYTFEQESGDSDIVVRHFVGYVQTNSDDDVSTYIIDLLRVSGAAIDNDKLVALLESETISLSNTDDDKEDAELGSAETVLKGKVIDLGAVKIKGLHTGAYIEKTDINGNKIITPILRPATVNVNTLPDVSGSTTIKTIPGVWDFDTIHHDNDSTKSIVRIPNPSVIITHQGTHRTIAFHNINSDGDDFTIEDWNGNGLIILGEGERAVFQITLEGGANGGTLLGIDIPDRSMSYFKTSPTEAESWVVSDYPRWSNGTYRYSLIPISDTDSTDQLVIQDASIIRIPTNTQPVGNQGQFNSETSFNFDGVVQVRRPGTTRVEGLIRIRQDGSGNLANDHGLQFRRIDQSATYSPVSLTRDVGIAFGADNAMREFSGGRTTKNDANDLFFLIFVYPPGSTIGPENLRFVDIQFTLIHSPYIAAEWSA